MTLQQYEERKQERLRSAWSPRPTCERCKKSVTTCYCSFIRPFESSPEFVILIHREEIKRSIATGRMSHLCVTNSRLFKGYNYSDHEGVNAILEDKNIFPVVLYPSRSAINLTELTLDKRKQLFPEGKRPVVFVIDATWAQARQMIRHSRNLASLPTISFSPPTLSAFHVRKQPNDLCYSTIESIHHVIDLFGGGDSHHNLLDVFAVMVNQQLAFGHNKLRRRGISAYAE